MRRWIQVFLLFYLAGFLAGIICTNYMSGKSGVQASLLPVYLLLAEEGGGKASALFGELLWERGRVFFLYAAVGATLGGSLLVFAGLLWFGFLAGNLMTMFLLDYGIRGILLGLACFFPQALFYIPGWLFFFFVVFQMSQKCWKKMKRTKEDYKAYAFFLSMSAILILLGIWLESYVNQEMISYVAKQI